MSAGEEAAAGDLRAENDRLRASLKDLQRSFGDFSQLKEKELQGLRAANQELSAATDSLARQVEILEEEAASGQKHIRVLQKALKSNLAAPGSESASRRSAQSLASEPEELRAAVDTLQTQNAFLLSQVGFLERRLEGAQRPGGEDQLHALCRILGAREPSRLVEAATKVQQVCRQLPPLQSTLQDIHALVSENNIIPVSCGSLADLVEILENWAGNLRDYHQLVRDLFELLRITDERQKNRSFLLESVRRLAGRGGADPPRAGSAAEFFVEEARRRLALPVDASAQAVLAKALRALEERGSGARARMRLSSASNSVLPSGDEH